MRVDLIHPPVYVNPKALTGLRPSPPLGLAYVAAAIERAGHSVRVIDALAAGPERTEREGRVLRLGLPVDEIVGRIDPEARVVGVTNMWSFAWPVVRDLIRRIREARPDVTIVCGGEHFNGLPDLSMEQAPIDYVVRGEGEETIVELLSALDRGDPEPATIAGIVWRDGDRIVTNPARDRIGAIDQIPWPAWHLFDLETYNRHGMKIGIDYGTMVPILATRGCPYSCTYCSSPRMWTTRWLARDPKDVADEIEHFAKVHGANNFPFQDLTAIIRREWIVDFCRELIARKLDVRWQLPSGTRCETVDDEVAELLVRSGCRSLCYAPESGSDAIRKRIRKRMKKESLFAAVDAAVRHGINLTAFIVLGFPDDTDREIRENLAFVRELARRGVEDVACGFFFPIPATSLFDELRDEGRITLSDTALLAPILSHDRFLTESRNYCRAIPAWRLTLYKVLVVLNFYAVAIAGRPRRFARIVANFVHGREESKFDSFLRIYARNLARRFRRRREALEASR